MFNLINKYSQIILYRHINPDLDAFGSQIGMYHILKENYKDKKIIIAGSRTSDLCPLFFDDIEDEQYQSMPTLGIVLDTANSKRIDGDISLCNEVIKIDHHIIVENYGDINIVDEKASSCSEVLTLECLNNNIVINKEAANALYLGIIGDSNRFLYSSTTINTFKAASCLLNTGIDIASLYQKIYLKDAIELEVNKFILNNYIVDGNVAYYILKDNDLKKLSITREEGSNYVNVLSNIKQYKVWMAITENIANKNYRVSIRSRDIIINDVAALFNGGGHYFASGATLDNIEQLDLLINKLKEKINEKN